MIVLRILGWISGIGALTAYLADYPEPLDFIFDAKKLTYHLLTWAVFEVSYQLEKLDKSLDDKRMDGARVPSGSEILDRIKIKRAIKAGDKNIVSAILTALVLSLVYGGIRILRDQSSFRADRFHDLSPILVGTLLAIFVFRLGLIKEIKKQFYI